MPGPTPAGAHAVRACAAGPQTLTVDPSVGRAADGCAKPLPGTAHTSAEDARDALFWLHTARQVAGATAWPRTFMTSPASDGGVRQAGLTGRGPEVDPRATLVFSVTLSDSPGQAERSPSRRSAR